MTDVTRVHGTCVARDAAGVLLLGASGTGKSDLALRLLARGFDLVADDQVLIAAGIARPPPTLAGLLEVRGLGIVRVPNVAAARLRLAVELGEPERLPAPSRHDALALPTVRIRAESASAVDRVALALDCVLGIVTQVSGAFAR